VNGKFIRAADFALSRGEWFLPAFKLNDGKIAS
jgi:hypothetical protein